MNAPHQVSLRPPRAPAGRRFRPASVPQLPGPRCCCRACRPVLRPPQPGGRVSPCGVTVAEGTAFGARRPARLSRLAQAGPASAPTLAGTGADPTTWASELLQRNAYRSQVTLPRPDRTAISRPAAPTARPEAGARWNVGRREPRWPARRRRPTAPAKPLELVAVRRSCCQKCCCATLSATS